MLRSSKVFMVPLGKTIEYKVELVMWSKLSIKQWLLECCSITLVHTAVHGKVQKAGTHAQGIRYGPVLVQKNGRR